MDDDSCGDDLFDVIGCDDLCLVCEVDHCVIVRIVLVGVKRRLPLVAY